MTIIHEGILLGLTLSLFLGWGPALFALIQTSIHRGFLGGVLLAFGIFLSDLFLIGLGLIGAVQVFYKPNNQLLFGIIGSIILIAFGIVTYRRKVKVNINIDNENSKKDDNPGPLTYVLKGFFLNSTNPFVWIFWMGIVVGFTANYQGTLIGLFSFFATALLTVFGIDILKAFSAYKIKRFIKTEYIDWINKITGIGLIIFGIYLIFRTLVMFNVL
jgi:threonine/homoserine/homoserine lactone efflux protein